MSCSLMQTNHQTRMLSGRAVEPDNGECSLRQRCTPLGGEGEGRRAVGGRAVVHSTTDEAFCWPAMWCMCKTVELGTC